MKKIALVLTLGMISIAAQAFGVKGLEIGESSLKAENDNVTKFMAANRCDPDRFGVTCITTILEMEASLDIVIKENKLILIEVQIPRGGYEQLLNALVTKYGKPTGVENSAGTLGGDGYQLQKTFWLKGDDKMTLAKLNLVCILDVSTQTFLNKVADTQKKNQQMAEKKKNSDL